MIRPSNFGYNPLTAQSNAFQSSDPELKPEEISEKAKQEFDHFVELLLTNGINTFAINDKEDVILPDSVFPNNWISFHHDGTVVLYPMLAVNRRPERRPDILLHLQNDHNLHIETILDYTEYEVHGRFLEGTGSVVFDYKNKIAYANVSPRTDEIVFNKMCEDLGYKKVMFVAQDPSGQDIYHTNVMMCIGNKYVVICLEAIPDDIHRAKLLNSFEKTGLEVIEINYRQLEMFAGNMIEVYNDRKESILIMSKSAFKSLDKDQLKRLDKLATILYAPIPVIQKYGGGSVRCMIAGVFLPKIQFE